MGRRSKENWDVKPPPVIGTGEGDLNKTKWRGEEDTYSWYRYKGLKKWEGGQRGYAGWEPEETPTRPVF